TNGAAGFEQPLVSQPGIGGTPGFGVLQLVSLVPLTLRPVAGNGQPLNLNLPRPYNNMAVPGADVVDLVSTTQGGINDLILRRTGFTQLQQGLSLQPTFVTLWIGNNDALGAATSGIVNDQTLTPLPVFEQAYRTAAAAIAQVGARMAVANIPDVTSIPYVTTIPRVVVNPQTSQPVLGPNGQPIPLIGPNGPLVAGDFVLLPASALLAQGFGLPPGIPGSNGQPLPDGAVLSASEVATIRARVQGYNAVIRAVATERNAAFVDANAELTRLATTGVNVGGITYTGAFLTGGIFSYDGVHPNAFGYAYLANLFIEAINARFGGEIPLVNLYPFVFGGSTVGSTAASIGEESVPFIYTLEARRSLLKALNVPQRVIDGKPRRRGGRG
ncbi:MAG TPA: SGNH/GDSL hydrolase family protein, partial [Thermoanaerobaculia bacterium]|nr:SGNH/GDSL hydrolase family protein [Thermoanaerobaculia bacterium]